MNFTRTYQQQQKKKKEERNAVIPSHQLLGVTGILQAKRDEDSRDDGSYAWLVIRGWDHILFFLG